MAATTNGSLIKDYRARLDDLKRSDAERITLVDVQRDASCPAIQVQNADKAW